MMSSKCVKLVAALILFEKFLNTSFAGFCRRGRRIDVGRGCAHGRHTDERR